MTEAIAWTLAALLVAAAIALGWMLRPEEPEEQAPDLPPSDRPMCATCPHFRPEPDGEHGVCSVHRDRRDKDDGCEHHPTAQMRRRKLELARRDRRTP